MAKPTGAALDWQQRRKLCRKPLAQALHAYFSSHRAPFPVKLQFLQSITGAKNSQPASFKRQAKAALDQLVKIGFLDDYTFTWRPCDRLPDPRSPPSRLTGFDAQTHGFRCTNPRVSMHMARVSMHTTHGFRCT